MDNQELEVKFFVKNLKAIENRMIDFEARLIQPRTHEINLRFDTPDGNLTGSSQVLRLRQDTLARVTYKGPGYELDGVRVRKEIEFTVSDFRAARQLFQVLGYQVSMIYEKFRTVYFHDDVHVTLDELPYGNFIEIEGENAANIHALNKLLGLDWETRIPVSYTELFFKLRVQHGLEFRDLIFENFSDINVSPEDLGVKASDA